MPLKNAALCLLLLAACGRAWADDEGPAIPGFDGAQPAAPGLTATPQAWTPTSPAKPAQLIPIQFNGQYNLYQSSDGVVVNSPKGNVGIDLDERTHLALEYSVDAVSAASYNYAQSKTHQDRDSCFDCHTRLDALSGATHTYMETRQEYVFGVKRKLGEADFSASYTLSQENDYTSNGLTLGWDQYLAGRNTVLGLRFQHLSDSLSPVWDRAFSAGISTNGVDLNLTQILTPKTEARLGVAWALAQGYLTDPYAFIQVGNDINNPVPANQPDSKQRWDATFSLKQALPDDSAVQFDYRYYADSWDVRAHTFDLSYTRKIGAWILEPEYRYYAQSGAFFFQNFYPQARTYMTRDLKLADYATHFLSLALRGALNENWDAEFRYSHFLRVDNLDYSLYYADAPTQADLFQIGLTLH